MFLGRVLVIKITQCPDIEGSLLFETPKKGSVLHLREFVIVLALWVFQGSTTLRLASRGLSGFHEPPEDPPCDASIESSSHWCGALVRHPREQCNVHSIPIPFNVTKLSHLFPLKTCHTPDFLPVIVLFKTPTKQFQQLIVKEITLYVVMGGADHSGIFNRTSKKFELSLVEFVSLFPSLRG
ncbi:hypothetical protein TNCV_2710891 [Trichonephila clavipes]|nr:hypothetical protein TNCV_2710891 [Trichonephila clavipes]